METYRNAHGYSKLRKSRLERCATIPILLVMSEFDPSDTTDCSRGVWQRSPSKSEYPLRDTRIPSAGII